MRFLGLFPPDDNGDLSQSCLLAMTAGQKMIEAMEKFSAIDVGEEEPASLKLKIGMSSGDYFSAHLGSTRDMVFMAMGATVNSAERAEGYGEAGEIIIDSVTQERVADSIESEEREEGYYLLKEVTGELSAVSAESRFIRQDEYPSGGLDEQIKYLIKRLDYLTPYLPANLLQRMVASPEEAVIPPDYRPVSILFVNFGGLWRNDRTTWRD